MSDHETTPKAELFYASLSCLSEHGRFLHSCHVVELRRERNSSAPPPPLGPITLEEIEDAADPVYMDALIFTATIQAKYDNMTDQDFKDRFSARLEDMNRRMARLGLAIMALLPEGQSIESYGVDPASDHGKVVVDHSGLHHYLRRDDSAPHTYDPKSEGFYMGYLDIEVVLPYLCDVATKLVK